MLALPLYLLAKLAAYYLWCHRGLLRLSDERDGLLSRALRLGAVRLVLGLVLGLLLSWALSQFAPRTSKLGFPLSYLLVSLTVLRWFEWSIISTIIQLAEGRAILTGSSTVDRQWRLGGVLLSYFTDFVILIGGVGLYGIPC